MLGGKKKFEKLLMKNTLAIVLPAMVVFLVLTALFVKHPLFRQVRCIFVSQDEDYNELFSRLYSEKTTNVEMTVRELYYTGFDYYIDGEIEGAYYYNITKDKMCIYLIETTKPKDYIESVDIKGRIVKNDISVNHIINRLAETNHMDVDLLMGYCLDYMVSELDYPHAYILMLYVFFAIPIILAVLILLYTLITWYKPENHAQCKQLSVYGQIPAIIEELNAQLRHQLLFKKNKVYITRDYMIVNYFTKTDVIKLDYVTMLSKNLIEKRTILGKKIEVFRLTMADPERLFYEVDFLSEELADDVVGYIRGVNAKEKTLDTEV